jgi:hypothetical protein
LELELLKAEQDKGTDNVAATSSVQYKQLEAQNAKLKEVNFSVRARCLYPQLTFFIGMSQALMKLKELHDTTVRELDQLKKSQNSASNTVESLTQQVSNLTQKLSKAQADLALAVEQNEANAEVQSTC